MNDNLSHLNFFFSGSSFVLLLFFLGLLVRQRATVPNFSVLVLLLSSCILYLLWFNGYSAQGGFLNGVFTLGGAGLVWCLWVYSKAYFSSREFRFKPIYFSSLGLMYVVVLAGLFDQAGYLEIPRGSRWVYNLFRRGIEILWFLAALSEVLQGWTTDLNENRRQVRQSMAKVLLGVFGAVLLINQVYQLLFPFLIPRYLEADVAESFLLLLRNGLCTGVLFFILFKVVRIKTTLFQFNLPVGETVGVEEKAVIDRLQSVMRLEKLFLDSGLKMNHLAQQVDLKEYKLRQLINRHLGYDNFNDYLNHFRIEEAKLQLSGLDRSITEIAFDSGFGSLSSFNRAFLRCEGVSPSAFKGSQVGSFPQKDQSNP